MPFLFPHINLYQMTYDDLRHIDLLLLIPYHNKNTLKYIINLILIKHKGKIIALSVTSQHSKHFYAWLISSNLSIEQSLSPSTSVFGYTLSLSYLTIFGLNFPFEVCLLLDDYDVNKTHSFFSTLAAFEFFLFNQFVWRHVSQPLS